MFTNHPAGFFMVTDSIRLRLRPTDVMQERRGLEQVPVSLIETVPGFQRVKKLLGQECDLSSMFRLGFVERQEHFNLRRQVGGIHAER